MSARGRPDAAAEQATARGGSLLAGRYDLPFVPAALTNPSGAALTVIQLVIGSQGA
jgi:hypothetical protein